jgi:hypothetical protein
MARGRKKLVAVIVQDLAISGRKEAGKYFYYNLELKPH